MDGFPDVEQAVCEFLEDIAPTYTVTPPEVEPPYIQVNRTGGRRSQLQDHPVVTVTCVAATRDVARNLDNRVRDRMSDARGIRTSAGFLDKIREDSSALPLPFPAVTELREIVSTWVVTSRLQNIN